MLVGKVGMRGCAGIDKVCYHGGGRGFILIDRVCYHVHRGFILIDRVCYYEGGVVPAECTPRVRRDADPRVHPPQRVGRLER